MADTLLNAALKYGYITKEQKEKADVYKKETGANDETAVRDMKLISEETILDIYSKIYGYTTEIEPEISDTGIAENFEYTNLLRYGFIPVREDKKMRLITSQPADLLYAEDLVRDKTGYRGSFEYSLVTASTLVSLL